MPNHICALLFDLDDTLYSRNAAFLSWTHAFVRNDLGLTEDDPHYQKAVEHIIGLDAWGYSPRETLFRTIQETYYPTMQDGAGQLLATYNRRFLDHILPEETTQHALTELTATGVPFGIITNGPTHRQYRKIQILGLDQLTSCIFISEHFGHHKPDPEIFLAAAACLGHKPADILFVGDNAYIDIVGAHRVGMRTAWMHLQREWPADLQEVSPDYMLGSLSEICELL